jgi:catechol 2,3-dioxygenase-like lactoylglutathione lyase family enzyme
MIIDHIGIGVRDFAASRVFYTAALKPLGIGIIMEFEGAAGMGRGQKPEFWFSGTPAASQHPVHLALAAENRAQVRAFHDAAIKAGGKDNGPPGIREQYHPTYYGAFVLDPDGNNLEAVCHGAEG